MVKKNIDDNPYSTYDEIEAETQLSRGAIERIIHDSLDLKKITSRWVPHVLTERNRKSRVSICRKNLRLFSKKTWRLCDVVTGDESWFYHRKIDCLKPLVKTLNQRRPTLGTKNLKFHHDNARPHVHSNVIKYLKSKDFIMMDHPPYSPDLAPSDFWLFDYIKERLTTQRDEESLAAAITKIVSEIPKKEFAKTFDKWIMRMKLCILNKGDYFEHLIK